MRTTTAAPLSLARSEGRGSNASGSAAGGTIVSTSARSPATTRARLARSLVVATTRRLAAAAAWATNAAIRTAERLRTVRRPTRPRTVLRSAASTPLPLRNEDALGQQAVHGLLGIRDRADPAIHRHAGEPIGVEARDLLLALQPLDHGHRGLIHRLVEIGVFGV